MPEPAARQRLREAREKATAERESAEALRPKPSPAGGPNMFRTAVEAAAAALPDTSAAAVEQVALAVLRVALPLHETQHADAWKAAHERAVHFEWETVQVTERAEKAEAEAATVRAWMADPYNPRQIAIAVQRTYRQCDEAVQAITVERDECEAEAKVLRAELERYRGLDAAAKELLARNVEFGTRADNAEARCGDLEDEVKRVRNDNDALIKSCRKWMNQATVDFDRARDASIELERMRAYTGPTVKIEWGVQDATTPVDPLNAVVCDSRVDARRDTERYEREVLTNDKPTPYRVVTRLAGAWIEVPDA